MLPEGVATLGKVFADDGNFTRLLIGRKNNRGTPVELLPEG